MTYEKPFMNMSELKRMGLPEVFLRKAFADGNPAFAWKVNETKENSPIIFDTEGLEKYRLQQIEFQKKCRVRQGVY